MTDQPASKTAQQMRDYLASMRERAEVDNLRAVSMVIAIYDADGTPLGCWDYSTLTGLYSWFSLSSTE